MRKQRCHVSPAPGATSSSLLDKVLRSHLRWPEGERWREVRGAGVAALATVGALKQQRTARRGAAALTAPRCRLELRHGEEFQGQVPEQATPVRLTSPAQHKLGSPASKDELQGGLDVPPSGLQRSEAQLVVVYAHVSQLLELGLPLALQRGNKSSSGWRAQAAIKQPALPRCLLPPLSSSQAPHQGCKTGFHSSKCPISRFYPALLMGLSARSAPLAMALNVLPQQDTGGVARRTPQRPARHRADGRG